MSNALVKRTAGGAIAKNLTDEEWYYERVEKMRRFRQDPALALSHDIIPKEGGGYMLVTLKESKRVMAERDDSGHNKSTSQFKGGYSGHIGFDRAPAKGKYNDESRLTLTETVSVEVGEITAFASM